jgi:hypothetical protein
LGIVLLIRGRCKQLTRHRNPCRNIGVAGMLR